MVGIAVAIRGWLGGDAVGCVLAIVVVVAFSRVIVGLLRQRLRDSSQ